MSFDHDYPMTRTQVRVLVVGLLVMAVFGAALFGGAIPGLTPNYAPPSFLELDGQPYYYTTVTVAPLLPLGTSTPPAYFPFHNVTFAIWISDWYSLTGGMVNGNGTELNGTVYSFALGVSVHPPSNVTLFVSPDHVFAVYWGGGVFGGNSVRLMVRATPP